MNISPWTVYWITRLDSIGVFFGLFGFFLLFCCTGSLIVTCDKEACDVAKNFWEWWVVCSSVGLIFFVISCLVPSTKEMAAIILIPKIANNEKVAAMPSKIVDLANEWLDTLKPKGDK